MKKHVCEVCGSTSLKKIDDNTFKCQNCGFVISTACINAGSGLSDVSDSTIVQSEPIDDHSVDNELHKEISDNDKGFCDADFSESTSEKNETVCDNSNISEETIYENSESASADDNLPNAISAIGFADNFGAESINIKSKKSSKGIDMHPKS
jgi:transcription initiation factor TFIIIB Brf1 subunit/transcription initiation factor TFIIB